MRERLAFYLPSLAGGGAERVITNLANQFVKQGHGVDVLLHYPEIAYRQELDTRVGIHLIPLRRRLLGLYVVAKTAPYFRKGYAAILSCIRNFPPLLAKRLTFSGTRVVVREAAQPSRILREVQRKPLEVRIATKLGYRYLYPLTDAVIAVSKGVADDLLQITRIPSHKMHVIYNPMITEDFYAMADAPVEHPWFTVGATPIVIGVGRLHPVKGFDTLLCAFARAVREVDARLVILGEGEERHRLEQLAQELGIAPLVSMPGFDPNPLRYLRRASVYVLASRSEGMPGALIQALASGCPVVATSCCSGVLEVTEGGKYGTIVPVDDVDAMAEAILLILRGKRHPLPTDEWFMRFRADTVASQYLQVMLGK